MKFQIRNIRGVERADIDVSPIAILAGTGGAGKSSACFAISAVSTGQPVVGGVKAKSRAGELIRVGCSKGSVIVESEGGQADIAYPKAEYNVFGDPVTASAYAIGTLSLPELDPKKRGGEMSEYISVEPTKKDLIHFLGDEGVNENVVDKVWEKIQEHGWDGTLEQGKARRIELKGLWREITGQEYGSKKAETWVPDDWFDGLDATSLDSLQRERSEANQVLEKAIGKAAVSEDRLESLRQRASILEDAEAALEKAKERHDVLSDDASRVQRELDKIPSPPASLPKTICPECGCEVGVEKGLEVKLVKLDDPDVDEPAERTEQRNRLQDNLAKVQRELSTAKGDVRTQETAVEDAKKAQKELDEIEGSERVSQEEVDKAREALREADSRINAFNKYTSAHKHHRSIQTNQSIINALEQDGVRKLVLLRGIKAFNEEKMEPLCAAAKWPTIELTPDLSVTFDGREYPDLSRSEKARGRIILQLAMAMCDGSGIVVIDDLDVLPPSTRGGVIRAVQKTGISAVIALMTEKISTVPDLEKAGAGISYWMENGNAVPFSQLISKNREAA